MKVLIISMAIIVSFLYGTSSVHAASSDLNKMNAEIDELFDKGKYGSALIITNRALTLAREQYGVDHLITANYIQYKAQIFEAQHKDDAAAKLYEQALSIKEDQLGPDNLEVADVMIPLANYYKRTDKKMEAELMLERALKILEGELGPDNEDVQNVKRMLSEVRS